MIDLSGYYRKIFNTSRLKVLMKRADQIAHD
jgi:hypothetical protein